MPTRTDIDGADKTGIEEVKPARRAIHRRHDIISSDKSGDTGSPFMRKASTLWKWAAVIVIFGGVLMLLAPILTPYLFNQETIRAQLKKRVAAGTDIQIDFQGAHLTVLPRPYLNVRQIQIARGPDFSLKAVAVRIYPKLMPLFRGRLQFDRISLEFPIYTLHLPEVSISAEESGPPGGIDEVHRQLDRFRYLVAQLAPVDIPDIELNIRNGRVILLNMSRYRPGFELRHINGHYGRQRDRMDFSVDGMSNSFREIAVRGWLEPETFRGLARVDLAAFQPESLLNHFYPNSKLQVSDAQLNVSLDIDVESKEQMRVQLMGSMPRLRVKNGEAVLNLHDQKFRGEIILEKKSLGIHLSDFTSADPGVTLTGKFRIDDAVDKVNLQLAAGSVDVAGVRAAALALMGEDETAAKIFDVLRSGRVPRMTVTAVGERLSDLEAIENFNIAGRIEDGRLHIPDLDFDLQAVAGDALIHDGILEGRQLQARLGDSLGSDGGLKLDLGDGDLFELDIRLRADLAQLPPVLRKVIDDRAFISELDRIGEVSGQADGRLTIISKKRRVGVEVDVDAMSLSATYNRIPYPLTVNRGELRLVGDRITLSNMELDSGNTRLKGLTGSIDWGSDLTLDLQAAEMMLESAELKNWLPDRTASSFWATAIKDLKGSARLEPLRLGYSSSKAGQAGIDIAGNIALANLTGRQLPGDVAINGGAFRYRGGRLELTGLKAEVGRSYLEQADVRVDWTGTGGLKASAGRVELDLAEFYPWMVWMLGDGGASTEQTSLSGKLRLINPTVNGPIETPAAWQWDTGARLDDVQIVSPAFGAPLVVPTAELAVSRSVDGQATGSRIELKSSEIEWGQSRLSIGGRTLISEKGLDLDLNIASDRLSWSQVERLIDQMASSDDAEGEPEVRGTLSVRAEQFDYQELVWRPVNATLTLFPGRTHLDVARAGLCGIDFSGDIDFAADRVDMRLVPVAKGKALAPTMTCLSKNKNMATGQYDFSGTLEAKSTVADLGKSVSGDLRLAASGGRIHRFGVLAKIFSILNVTEVYRGQLPDLTGEGFAYETMTIVADVDESKLIMRECAIEAPLMGLACEGEIDLARKQMDLVILVAPFRTVDRIVKHIPIVGGIMGGKLISIPFRAKGELGNPYVIPLSPTAVGSGVLGILERTLKLPITLMEPLFSNSQPEKAPSENKE